MDVDEIMARQVEQLEKEKKELMERLKAQEKKVIVCFLILTDLICIWMFNIGSLVYWVECLLMVQETGVQSQVVSYQRL